MELSRKGRLTGMAYKGEAPGAPGGKLCRRVASRTGSEDRAVLGFIGEIAIRILEARNGLPTQGHLHVASGEARLEGGRVQLKDGVNQADFLFSPMA